MNPVVLFFVSGDALYLGSGLLFVAVATSYSERKCLRRNRNLFVFVALAIMVMASPPFPWVVVAIFLMVLALWCIGWNRSVLTQIWARIRLFATVGAVVGAFARGGMEASDNAHDHRSDR